MKRNVKIFAGFALLLAIIIVFAGMWRANLPQAVQGEKSITVTVVHSDKEQNVFEYTTDEEFLGIFLMDAGLIGGDEGEFGLFVTMVDGETADYMRDKSWWMLSKNGEMLTTGADQTPICDGEKYEWTYTIG